MELKDPIVEEIRKIRERLLEEHGGFDDFVRYLKKMVKQKEEIKVQISMEDFQTEYLKFMDDIQKFHNEIIITKLGKPVAEIIPIPNEQSQKSLFGYMKDSVVIHEDILKPIEENWEVDK